MNKLQVRTSTMVLISFWTITSFARTSNIPQNVATTNLSTLEIHVSNVKSTDSKGEKNALQGQSELDAEVNTKLNSLSASGGVNGGGGDQIGLEFEAALKSALHKIEATNPKMFSEINLKLQKSSLERRIIVVDDTLDVQLRNIIQTSVAANVPSLNLILLNRSRWTGIYENELREGIALHEGLSLVGLEQTGFYPFSSAFVFEQGLAKTQLEKALSIDRVKQISAENRGLSRHQILKKYFDEAPEEIGFDDISDDAARQNINRKCVMTLQENETTELQLSRQEIILVHGSEAKPQAGPLLPEIAGTPDTKAPGVNVRAEVSFDGFKILNMSGELKRTSPKEIVVGSTTKNDQGIGEREEVLFRKNNGLLVLKWALSSGASKRNAEYAYCYNKP